MLWWRLLRLSRHLQRCGWRILRAPLVLYRHDLGWLLGRRFCCLTHTGRASGRVHRTPLEVLGRGAGGEVYVLCGRGPHADWLRNITVAPALRLQTGRRDFLPVHRVLPPKQADGVLAAYERDNRLLTPVIRPLLSRLSGVRYDGTAATRGAVVARLPVVGFRPADEAVTTL